MNEIEDSLDVTNSKAMEQIVDMKAKAKEEVLFFPIVDQTKFTDLTNKVVLKIGKKRTLKESLEDTDQRASTQLDKQDDNDIESLKRKKM